MFGTESSLNRRLMVLKSRFGKGCRAGISTTATAPRHNRGQRGTELVEFGLVFIPLLAMVFLIVNIAWIYFAQESLQHAVLAGIRYAVTGNVMKNLGQDASIKSIVQDQAMGFLAGPDGLAKITINYYSPTNVSNTATALTGIGSNAGGNIVEIRVNGVSVSVLGPLVNGGPLALNLSAVSTDVMESSPGGIPPAR